MKYVSIAKSRAGSTEQPEEQAEAPAPETSVTPTAKSNTGGKSASKTEEG